MLTANSENIPYNILPSHVPEATQKATPEQGNEGQPNSIVYYP